MQYIIFPDKYHPTHTAPDSSLVRVQQVPDGQIRTPLTVVASLAGYTALPAQTPEQIAAGNAAEALDQAKAKKLRDIEAAYELALAAGVPVSDPNSNTTPPATITLAAGDTDQSKFAQGCVAVNTAELLASDVTVFRAALVSTVFNRPVTDAAGGAHDMTVTQYRQLSIAYAAAIGALQNTLLLRTAAARAATTIEQLTAV